MSACINVIWQQKFLEAHKGTGKVYSCLASAVYLKTQVADSVWKTHAIRKEVLPPF
jgi:hypothetical protein